MTSALSTSTQETRQAPDGICSQDESCSSQRDPPEGGNEKGEIGVDISHRRMSDELEGISDMAQVCFGQVISRLLSFQILDSISSHR